MGPQDASGLDAPAAGLVTAPPHGGSVRPSAVPLIRIAARWPGRLIARHWAQEALTLAGFLAAGVAATWPRASYLTGKMPLDGDQAQYVWSLWWVARQVTHLGNPWFTAHLAAPVGVQLGYDTLMPLAGLLMTPVTLAFGAAVSYNLLALAAPGLAAYAMYRVARLWLPSRVGAIAAGAFFGLSAMLDSQAWLHVHTALGCVFLPLSLEAAVRLRRAPTVGRGIVLGLVIGASVLVDQEAGVLAAVLAALALVPWLLRRLDLPRLRAAAAGAVTAVVIASPQLLAMMQTGGRGGPAPPPVSNYARYAARLPGLFAPSPRLTGYGITGLGSIYSAGMSAGLRASKAHELVATFGLVLTLLAAFGLAASWRRRGSKGLALLWLGSSLLALGPTLYIGGRKYVPLPANWHGIRVSELMPYTWLIRLPGLSSFREADRLALLGLVGAALLAGASVDWLRRNAWPLIIVVAVAGAFEAGWAGISGDITVPTALPALDRPIAADHSGSIVVDVPFIIRGPQRYGTVPPPFSLVLATADGHPRGISISSAVPERTIAGISSHAFYSGLVAVEEGRNVTLAHLATARLDVRKLGVGWVLVWSPRWTPGWPPETARAPNLHRRQVLRYLKETGFVFDYRADGVLVYRPLPAQQAAGGRGAG